MHNSRTWFALAIASASLAAAAPSGAQELLLPAAPAKGVTLEGAYTDVDGSLIEFPSTVWFLTARAPLTDRVSAVVDLPFAYARVDDGTDSETNTVIGNPYLGVEYAASSQLKLEFGTRAPLTSAGDDSFADVYGFLSDPLRGEAFVEDLVPVKFAAVLTREVSPSFSLRALGGATELFYSGDSESDQETTVDYGVAGTLTSGNARFGLGFSGRWLATADEGSFGDNSFHYAGGTADILFRGVRPGISVRIPLDSELREAVNSTFGLYLQVPLR
jgi:hypothetical protein